MSKHPHLREVEEGWLAEKDVRQEHRTTGQHLDLVLTEIMAAQELAKVPVKQMPGISM